MARDSRKEFGKEIHCHAHRTDVLYLYNTGTIFYGGFLFVRLFLSVALLAAGCLPVVQAQEGVAGDASRPQQALRESSLLIDRTRLNEDDMPVFANSVRTEGQPDSRVILEGDAVLRRYDSVLKGNYIDYNGASGQVEARGDVRLMRDGGRIEGPGLRYNFETDIGEIEQPSFRIGPSGGAGKAAHAEIYGRNNMRLEDVIYSGCPCPDPAWFIEAERVDIDYEANDGEARNAVLYFKGVPLLASPYLTFPVRKERKSGLLLPTYGTTTKGGIDISVPYYLNLAPNYDLTLTPRLLTKRGMMLGGEFRYLGESFEGEMTGAYLPNDRVTHSDRWLYGWKHYHDLGNGFSADWDINRASDDNYFRDISAVGLSEASRTYLPRNGRVGWGDGYWSAGVAVESYQTLQDPDAPLIPPYDKLPELTFKGVRYNWRGLDLAWDNTATWFQRPIYDGQRTGPQGQRFVSYATMAYPIERAGWYITPKAGMHVTRYDTRWGDQNWYSLPGGMSSYRTVASRALPILSLDSGMVFERNTTLFGKPAQQTLEPRLYYLYVPYRYQDDLPTYDTALASFNMAQAFDENLYTGGWDRIANANQVTLGLTSRWMDASNGFERVSLSVAQRLYFEDQRVALPGEAPRQNRRSDLLMGATTAWTDTFSTQAVLQYDPHQERWMRSTLSARWRPQRLASMTLAYRYQRDPAVDAQYQLQGREQVSFAGQWPLSKRWYGVGRIDYSMLDSRVTQSIAGLEYKGDCCWAARAVFQRYAVAANDTNTTFFLQLELTGLGSLGTDPLGLLSRSIPGYESVNPSVPQGTRFDRYE